MSGALECPCGTVYDSGVATCPGCGRPVALAKPGQWRPREKGPPFGVDYDETYTRPQAPRAAAEGERMNPAEKYDVAHLSWSNVGAREYIDVTAVGNLFAETQNGVLTWRPLPSQPHSSDVAPQEFRAVRGNWGLTLSRGPEERKYAVLGVRRTSLVWVFPRHLILDDLYDEVERRSGLRTEVLEFIGEVISSHRAGK